MSEEEIAPERGLGWPPAVDAEPDQEEPGKAVGLGWPE